MDIIKIDDTIHGEIGEKVLNIGDWVVLTDDGVPKIVSGDIFADMYERVN